MAEETMWKTHDYYIKLPLAQALEASSQLEEKVWKIARKKGVEQTLQEAQFEIHVGKPALDPVTILVVVIGYVAMKAVDKVTDKALEKAWEVWKEEIWPEIKDEFNMEDTDEDE